MTGALSKIVGGTLKLSEIDSNGIGLSKSHCCNPSLPKKWSLTSSFCPPVYMPVFCLDGCRSSKMDKLEAGKFGHSTLTLGDFVGLLLLSS